MTLARLAELRHTPGILLAQKIVRRIPFRPIDVGTLRFLRLDNIPRVAPGLLRGPGHVRLAAIEDVDALVALRDQRQAFLDRFAEGDRCIVAEVGGSIVGYEWFCHRDSHEETGWGYRIAIPAGFIYAYDAFIDPRYRNSGIWLRFKAHLGRLMMESGHIGVLTFVDYGNWPSLRTHVRFGFKPAGDVFVLRILGKLLSRPSQAASDFGPSGRGEPVPGPLTPKAT